MFFDKNYVVIRQLCARYHDSTLPEQKKSIITRPAPSQFQTLEIGKSAKLMQFRNVAQNFWSSKAVKRSPGSKETLLSACILKPEILSWNWFACGFASPLPVLQPTYFVPLGHRAGHDGGGDGIHGDLEEESEVLLPRPVEIDVWTEEEVPDPEPGVGVLGLPGGQTVADRPEHEAAQKHVDHVLHQDVDLVLHGTEAGFVEAKAWTNEIKWNEE